MEYLNREMYSERKGRTDRRLCVIISLCSCSLVDYSAVKCLSSQSRRCGIAKRIAGLQSLIEVKPKQYYGPNIVRH